MPIDSSELKNKTTETGSDQVFTGDAGQIIKTDAGGLVDSSLIPPIGFELKNTFWADSNADLAGNGSAALPYQSLQAAVDKAELLGQGTRKIIFVAAASAFDEDVTVTDGYLTIMGLGQFTLGAADLDKFDSSTARDFTWNTPSVNTDANKWDGLIIGTIMDEETSSTHTAIMNGFTVSGDFLVNNPSGNSKNLQLRNVKVQGDFIQTGAQSVQTYLRRCFFDNAFTGDTSGMQLNIAESCEFDGLMTIGGYNRISQCQIQGGMTTTGPTSSLPPSGLFETDFSGTFTSVGTLRLDATTNYFFKDNGASLAGGATKVLLHDDEAVGVTVVEVPDIDHTASASELVIYTSITAARSITLPTGVLGDTICIVDGTGDVGSTNITVDKAGGGATFNGQTLPLLLDEAHVSCKLINTGPDSWNIQGFVVPNIPLVVGATVYLDGDSASLGVNFDVTRPMESPRFAINDGKLYIVSDEQYPDRFHVNEFGADTWDNRILVFNGDDDNPILTSLDDSPTNNPAIVDHSFTSGGVTVTSESVNNIGAAHFDGVNDATAAIASYNGTAAADRQATVTAGGAIVLPAATYKTEGGNPAPLTPHVHYRTYDRNAFYPHIHAFNGKMYMAWQEQDSFLGTTHPDSRYEIRVAVNEGTDVAPAWKHVDGNGDDGIFLGEVNHRSGYAILEEHSGKLYMICNHSAVALTSTSQPRVFVYNGNDAAPDWSDVTGQNAMLQTTLSTDDTTRNFEMKLKSANGKLYATFAEAFNKIRVMEYNDNDILPAWTNVAPVAIDADGSMNTTIGASGLWPELLEHNSELVVAWRESLTGGGYGIADYDTQVSVYDGATWTSLGMPTTEQCQYLWETCDMAAITLESHLGSLYMMASFTGPTGTENKYTLKLFKWNGSKISPAWEELSDATQGLNRAIGIGGAAPNTNRNAFPGGLVSFNNGLYAVSMEGGVFFHYGAYPMTWWGGGDNGTTGESDQLRFFKII